MEEEDEGVACADAAMTPAPVAASAILLSFPGSQASQQDQEPRKVSPYDPLDMEDVAPPPPQALSRNSSGNQNLNWQQSFAVSAQFSYAQKHPQDEHDIPLDLNDNDVLLTGATTSEPINTVGNARFRVLIDLHRNTYTSTNSRTQKREICNAIIQSVRHAANPSGRFFRRKADGLWHDTDDAEARTKIGQFLRRKHTLDIEILNVCTAKGGITHDSKPGHHGIGMLHPPRQERSDAMMVEDNQKPGDDKAFTQLFLVQQSILRESLIRAWREEEELEDDVVVDKECQKRKIPDTREPSKRGRGQG